MLGLGTFLDPLRVFFAGSGSANTVARSDHQHTRLDTLDIVGEASVGSHLTVEGMLLVGGETLIDAPVTVGGHATFEERVTMPTGLRIGNSILSAFAGGLPVAESYSDVPVHIQTHWQCGVTDGVMYHLRFKGYNFQAGSANAGAPFEFATVGYLYGAHGHVNHTITAVLSGGVTLTSYCASDYYLTFKLVNSYRWHASDLVIDLVGGDSGYVKRAADTFAVRQFVNSATDL